MFKSSSKVFNCSHARFTCVSTFSSFGGSSPRRPSRSRCVNVNVVPLFNVAEFNTLTPRASRLLSMPSVERHLKGNQRVVVVVSGARSVYVNETCAAVHFFVAASSSSTLTARNTRVQPPRAELCPLRAQMCGRWLSYSQRGALSAWMGARGRAHVKDIERDKIIVNDYNNTTPILYL